MKKKPLLAIPSFPGSNGEVDNLKTLKRCGFDCFVFRWNDSTDKLSEVDGYFFGAGFSYEDRGRSGMVAARDPLFDFIRKEAALGKVILGSCNGAQVLVESGLIPLGSDLKMCLARNAIREDDQWRSPGFLNEWVWITPTCAADRCAASDWSGVLHIPIAHGEGRFISRDPSVIEELERNNQVAFRYCTAEGTVSSDAPVTPNGSVSAIAGICNPEGNVVALMPHPERTELGDPYFLSVKRWIEKRGRVPAHIQSARPASVRLSKRSHMETELFIDTVITNNEERTVEQAARRLCHGLEVKQMKYVGLRNDSVQQLLSSLSFFNPNKEMAYVRKQGKYFRWNAEKKKLESLDQTIFAGTPLLRRDEPDTYGLTLGDGAETGICYDCRGVGESDVLRSDVCEVFCNPHASELSIMEA